MKNDCPMNHGTDGCYISGLVCGFYDKSNCIDYINYAPKRPMTRTIAELQQVNIKRLGDPMGAVKDSLDLLCGKSDD